MGRDGLRPGNSQCDGRVRSRVWPVTRARARTVAGTILAAEIAAVTAAGLDYLLAAVAAEVQAALLPAAPVTGILAMFETGPPIGSAELAHPAATRAERSSCQRSGSNRPELLWLCGFAGSNPGGGRILAQRHASPDGIVAIYGVASVGRRIAEGDATCDDAGADNILLGDVAEVLLAETSSAPRVTPLRCQ